MTDAPRPTMCECGWVEGSFACKIRHIALHTGDAKAANDFGKDDA